MLNHIKAMLNSTEGHQPRGGDWRDAVPNAEKTEPPKGLLNAVLTKLPLEHAAKSAARAQNRVTAAQGDLMKAEIALEQVRKDNAEREALHASYVDKRLHALKEAEAEFDRAQCHFLSEARDFGATNGKYVDYKSMAVKDDDTVPTVRIDHAER